MRIGKDCYDWNMDCGNIPNGKKRVCLLHNELKKLESVSRGCKDVMCIHVAGRNCMFL